MDELSKNGRIRVRKACVICKKRKVKCDGGAPCGNCVRHGQECRYDYTNSTRRTKYGKHGYGYGTKANGGRDGATNDVETHIANSLLRLSSPHGVPGGADEGNTGENSSGRICGTDEAVVQHRQSPWQSFSLDKYRFHRRYQNLLPYYLGASLLAGIPRQVVQTYNLQQPRIQNYGWNLLGGHFLRHDENSVGNNRLRCSPSDFSAMFNFDDPVHLSIIDKLLKFYFEEINPFLSIMHEPVFWKQFKNGFLKQNKVRNSSARLFLSILYLILAISLRFSEGLRGDTFLSGKYALTAEETHVLNETQREEPMFKYAYSIVTKLTFEWESFELIQSWLLITFYLRTCYRQTACWNALSQAVSMCNGMSLYLNRFPKTHPEYDETRAWHCFWACFIMDKLVTFQMGRFYQLSLPVSDMATPGNWHSQGKAKSTASSEHGGISESGGLQNDQQNDDDWFHPEMIQLFELSLIIMDCQKRNGEELSLEESLDVRKRMEGWYQKYVVGTRIQKSWDKLYQIQPFISYLDVRLTFETRRLFLLINEPSNTSEMIFPIDTFALVTHCKVSSDIMRQIFEKDLILVPWWLNLSQLFTVSVICITLIHSGLQNETSRTLLSHCMDIMNSLTTSEPKNPPQMLPECLWCLRMLNHMCCMRLKTSAAHLEMLVGTNPGDSSPNKNRFSQFGKIGEEDGDDDDELGDPDEQDYVRSHGQSVVSNLSVSSLKSHPFVNLPSGLSPADNLSVPMQSREMLQSPSKNLDPSDSQAIQRNSSSFNFDKAPEEIFDDGLFSYLQWFDQSFVP